MVFCHNDLQEGNILMSLDQDKENNSKSSELIIIGILLFLFFWFSFCSCVLDFEYCSYNYRSFDIANHFIEWVYNYSESKYPYYKEDLASYPSEKQRLLFIRLV